MSGALGALAGAVGALSFRDLGVFGEALGGLVGDAMRVRRAHVEQAMARAGVTDPHATASAFYASLGTSALELFWLAARRRDLRELVRFDAPVREVLGRTHARGVVFAASHTGNWEIASCAVAQARGLLVVTKHLSLGWADEFWQASRGRYGVSIVGSRSTWERARAQVRAGRLVAMMIDQAPARQRHALPLAFLGGVAWVERAAATLAARTGSLLAVPAARRHEDGSQDVTMLEVMEPPRVDGARARRWIDDATARATTALDAFVRRHPTEWLWMHRRWKTPVL